MSERTTQLSPQVSRLGAWSLAVGTAIGWGSLVITCNSFLAEAGPFGSLAGLALGAVVMLFVGYNYHYLTMRHPSAGGAYTFVKRVFGYDYGFVVAWFLALTYMAIFWANATSLPLFARFLLGDLFKVCHLYTVLGYEVYLGEVALTIFAVVCAALVCARGTRLSLGINTVLALVFCVGIVVCFGASAARHVGGMASLSPHLIPTKSLFSQVFAVACMTPWAFVGFENISNLSEEFSFDRKRTFSILGTAIVVSTVLYMLVTLLSIMAFPPQYRNWLSYITDLDHLSGLEGVPAFYVAHHFLGDLGTSLVGATLLSLVVTSLIGNLTAVSRLLLALARDRVLPQSLALLNKHAVPERTIALVAGVSCLVPFVGRTAIGWIVDVNTLGATLVYGFVSAVVISEARADHDRRARLSGVVGLVSMVLLGIISVLLNISDESSIMPESYILFTFWSLLGCLIFTFLLMRDKTHRFGNSSVAWVVLLSLTILMSSIWMRQADQAISDATISHVESYLVSDAARATNVSHREFAVRHMMQAMHRDTKWNVFLVMGLFGVSLVTIIADFAIVRRREAETERQLDSARSVAYTDQLTGVKSKHAYVDWEQRINDRIDEGYMPGFAVVVCDVNDLKLVNDTHGHNAGDKYLCEACTLICSFFKRSPVFRVGGDEFAAILEGLDYDVRDQLMDALNKTVERNVREGGVVVAAGISCFVPGEDFSVQPVFERADILMYQRKHQLKMQWRG